MQGHGAALHGIHSGLTALRSSFQRVVGGIDCSFARGVLEREVSMRKTICLRKHTEMTLLDTDQKLFFIKSCSEL